MQTQSLPTGESRQEKLQQGFISLGTVGLGQTHEVREFFSIGRDPENILVLGDDFISGRHARIERRSESFVLKDLRSRNGTFLNGSRVFEAILKDKDRIRVGKTDLIFTQARDQKQRKLHSQSKNEFWNSQLSKIPSVAQTSLPVLLLGESGTGKEILAKLIHQNSQRSHGPFISVNCSALGESLVESELFGHTKGSFTGATHDRKGAFEAARSGTLFLDEVGDLPLNLQPKLLRALENREIRPVGSDRTIYTDVRIVAATHQNLKQKVLQGKFRADLYFRLHVVQIVPPPLRLRLEDFEDLLYFFAKEERVRFSHAAIMALKQHSWPGNIRELKNVVSRARAFYSDREINEGDVRQLIDVMPTAIGINHAGEATDGSQVSIKDIEKKMIIERLIANGGNQRRTAEDLGMPKSTLHDRIRSYGIDVKALLGGGTLT